MKTGEFWEDFEWQREAGGYQWRNVASRRVLVARHSGGRVVTYRPFSKEYSGLFRTFGALDRTPEGVLEFANRYGMLGYPITRKFPAGSIVDASLVMPSQIQAPGVPPTEWGALVNDYPRETLSAIRAMSEAGQLDDAFLLSMATLHQLAEAQSLRLQPDEFLGEEFQWNEPPRDEGAWTWTSQSVIFARLVSGIDGNNSLLHQGLVNRGLTRTAAPHLEWSETERTFSLRLCPRSLLGAMYLQIALASTHAQQFKKCPVCGKPIDVSRSSSGARADAVFCSQACKSKDYRTRQADARRLAAAGHRPSEIAKQVRSDERTVLKWIGRA
jgi:endogenous inhibitor of DNA gyrase (YacG/DUF329 family)